MSTRSLIEINHDYGPAGGDEVCLELGKALRRYINSGDASRLPDGFTKIDMRHHSDAAIAAREGCEPAQRELAKLEIAKILSGAPHPSKKSFNKAVEILDYMARFYDLHLRASDADEAKEVAAMGSEEAAGP
jgi:hypothetical protein